MKKILRLTSFPIISTNGACLSQFERLVEIRKLASVSFFSFVSIQNFDFFKQKAFSWNSRFSKVNIQENRLSFFLTI